MTLIEYINELQSYQFLETDIDSTPCPVAVIDAAIEIVQYVLENDNLLPHYVIPTRSGGIAIDYRISETRFYYRIDTNNSIRCSILAEDFLIAKETVIQSPIQYLTSAFYNEQTSFF